MNCECWHFSKSQMPYRNTKLSISVGVRGTEVLATTQASDVKPGHGTKALIWGMKWEVEKIFDVWIPSHCIHKQKRKKCSQFFSNSNHKLNLTFFDNFCPRFWPGNTSFSLKKREFKHLKFSVHVYYYFEPVISFFSSSFWLFWNEHINKLPLSCTLVRAYWEHKTS